MKALRFDRHGKPDVLFVADRPALGATPGIAIVEMRAASINPSDVKNVAGRMSQTTLPRTPGRDYSGVVIDGPEQWLGKDVWGSGGDTGFTCDGTHAEQIAVPVASLREKPRTLTHAQAAAIGVNFITAWSAIVEAAQVQSGDTVAIIGLGGVGGAAAQIARHIGARIIGVARGTRPNPHVDELIDISTGDAVDKLRALTGGGASVVLDTVGGSMFETAVRMLALRGRLVEISATDRRQVGFDLADFYHNESRLFGVDSLKRDLTAAASILEALRPGFEDGSYLPPVIAQTFPLAEAIAAYRAVEAGRPGRIVLTP
ncbi:quinone oxidoreductase family protein [Caballeronia grimmiae]|uniref:Alcohol dehydrogenase n=1 Tax=Caballeronia grimmiae TaxID=1071679 RepID=A0A069N8N5_9BURK|nr:zinc-binding alcohol dehydrogenase family protein [Caballeronia grimmiae]KDR24728.1 alcohol dehydrogenase [Caballeronia grimmiae]GGD70280.1 oxidoreductase [Caballeronia grimmiae]